MVIKTVSLITVGECIIFSNNKLLYAVDRAIIEYKYSNKMIKLCFHLVVVVHNPGQFQLPVRIAIDHNYYVTLTKLQYYSQLCSYMAKFDG